MIEVELLGREGNVAVIRIPDRKFPGLFIQGDTMAAIRDLFNEVSGMDDLPDGIQEAKSSVIELLQYYEAVLTQNGITRPY